MKRSLPFFLVFLFGTFMVVQYFVPHERSEMAKEFLLDWIIIIGIFALALGIWSLISVSMDKINKRKPNWGYSAVTLVGLITMMFFGFTAHAEGSWWTYFISLIFLLAAIWFFVQGLLAAKGAPLRSIIYGLVFTAIFTLFAIFDNSWSMHFYTPEGLSNIMFISFFNHIMVPLQATMFALLAFFIASASYRAFRARNLLASLLLIAALIVMLRFVPGPWGELPAKTATWVMNVPNLAAQRAIVIGIGLGMVATALKVILGIERGYMGKG